MSADRKETLRHERLQRQNQALKEAQVIPTNYNDPFKYKAPVRRSTLKSGSNSDEIESEADIPNNTVAPQSTATDTRRKLIYNASVALFEYNGPAKLIPISNANPNTPADAKNELEQGLAVIFEPQANTYAIVVYEPALKRQLIRVEIDSLFSLSLLPTGVVSFPSFPPSGNSTPIDTAPVCLFTDKQGEAYTVYFKEGDESLLGFARHIALVKDVVMTDAYNLNKGVQTTVTQDLYPGPFTAPVINMGDMVKVQYSIYRLSNTHPQSVGDIITAPPSLKFVVGHSHDSGVDVPPGVEQGIIGMKKKGVRFLVVPAQLASESGDWGSGIPKNTPLCVELTIINHKQKDDHNVYKNEIYEAKPRKSVTRTSIGGLPSAGDVYGNDDDGSAYFGGTKTKKRVVKKDKDVPVSVPVPVEEETNEDEMFGKPVDAPVKKVVINTSENEVKVIDKKVETISAPVVARNRTSSVSETHDDDSFFHNAPSKYQKDISKPESSYSTAYASGQVPENKFSYLSPNADNTTAPVAATLPPAAVSAPAPTSSLSERMKRLSVAGASGVPMTGARMLLPTSNTKTDDTIVTPSTIRDQKVSEPEPVDAPVQYSYTGHSSAPSTLQPASSVSSLALLQMLALEAHHPSLASEAIDSVEDMLLLTEDDWKSISVPLVIKRKIQVKLQEIKNLGGVSQTLQSPSSPVTSAPVTTAPVTSTPISSNYTPSSPTTNADFDDDDEDTFLPPHQTSHAITVESMHDILNSSNFAVARNTSSPTGAHETVIMTSTELQARLDEAYDNGKNDTMIMCKNKIDQLKSTANKRFTELQEESNTKHDEMVQLMKELEYYKQENAKNKELVRSYVDKTREARKADVGEIDRLKKDLDIASDERAQLKDQYKAHYERVKTDFKDERKVIVKGILENAFSVVMQKFNANDIMDGEEMMRKLKDVLKGVATDALNRLD